MGSSPRVLTLNRICHQTPTEGNFHHVLRYSSFEFSVFVRSISHQVLRNPLYERLDLARRGNKEGTIYKRKDGRWTAAVSLENGNRRYLYGKTRQGVASQLNKALRDNETGIPFASDRLTVEQFLKQWLESVRPSLEESTFVRYEQYVRLHTVPRLGRVRLTRLSPHHLQELYAERLEDGLSPTTVNHLHACIHSALERGVRWGMIPRNVSDLVDPPKQAYFEQKPLSAEESKELLKAARGDRLEALYVLALTTGMRQGELLGLHWNDIDLDRGYISVRTTLKSGGSLKRPKSDSHRRSIVLTRLGIEALLQHRIRQEEEMAQAYGAWQDTGFVFTNTIGNHVDVHNLRKRAYPQILMKANLRYVRFHDLRHSTATLLLSLGIHPKIVQELLGHTNISITMDIYSHAMPTLQQDAMESLNQLLAS